MVSNLNSRPSMWQLIRSNKSLVVGLGIPFLLILYLLITVFIPEKMVKGKYNFLYASGCAYKYGFTFADTKLVPVDKNNNNRIAANVDPDCLYVYNVQERKSHKVTLKDAQTYKLNVSQMSLDGFSVQKTNKNDSFFLTFLLGMKQSELSFAGQGFKKSIEGSEFNSVFIGWIE